MGIFKSKDEIAKKQEELADKKLAEYGLKIDDYDEETLKKLNGQTLAGISLNLAGSGFEQFALAMQGKSTDLHKLGLASAQIKQNWVIIRQNELILRELRQIANNTSKKK